MREWLRYFGWEDVWLGVVLLAVLAGMALGYQGISTDHRVQAYTIVTENASQHACIMGVIDWWKDDTVYCSDDTEKLLKVLDHLNTTLK